MMSDTGLTGNVSMQTWVVRVDRPLHTEHFGGALKCNYTPRIWLMCVELTNSKKSPLDGARGLLRRGAFQPYAHHSHAVNTKLE